MATGFPTKANYAAGDILTAANMNDLSGTVNYLQYAKTQNPVLNSQFNVWQRGTSFSLAASTSYTSGFTVDRWQTQTGANQACTISRQATGDTTNLPNIQYCIRYQRNSGQTGTGDLTNLQNFETVNSIPFAGKAVTLSFYARAGANYSAASSGLRASLVQGTGTDQNMWTGFTGSSNVAISTVTLTTTWQRFTITGTVNAASTQLGIQFAFTPTGTASTNDYYEVTGVQLELGSVANTYQPNGATYQAELAACERYYEKSYPQGTAPRTNTIGSGLVFSPSQSTLANNLVLGFCRFNTVKRTQPSVSVYSYTSSTASTVSNCAGTDLASGSGTPSNVGDSGFNLNNNSGTTITPANGGYLFHFIADAEL